MADSKKIWNIIGIIWVVILVVLWIAYAWIPVFDLMTRMWIAIGWSALGGIFGSITFAAKSKRNLLIVAIIWIVILVFFWINYFLDFIPGADMFVWWWVTIACTIAVVIIAIGILVLKLMKKTQW